jgi:23S rRNA pseudouridine1911/1915/1917 synthase
MKIIYKDDRLIVCVKPCGVLSTDEPDGVPSLLRQELGDEKAVIRTVHRLDQVVGGVMVYARTSRAAADLQRQMAQGIFQKEYWAAVHGHLEQSTGIFEDMLRRDKGQRKTFVTTEAGPDVRPAKLSYRVLSEKNGLSLVSVRLHTGRTHQIRCQFASRGMPLWGDGKYGAPEQENQIGLWSHRLELLHPRTGERLVFVQETPETQPWELFR